MLKRDSMYIQDMPRERETSEGASPSICKCHAVYRLRGRFGYRKVAISARDWCLDVEMMTMDYCEDVGLEVIPVVSSLLDQAKRCSTVCRYPP